MLFLKFLFIFVFGNILAKPTDELQDVIGEAEMAIMNEASPKLMYIVPGVSSSKKSIKSVDIFDLIDRENVGYRQFIEYVDKGYFNKGLIFNIYDDNIRNATLSLFRLLQNVDEKTAYKIYLWGKENINDDIMEYTTRLSSLYGLHDQKEISPPFILKPNYFVNSEAIIKAAKLKIRNGFLYPNEARMNGYYRTDNTITINANYSGWNTFENPCEKELNYFREDIGLNSFYYGLHLLHPFYMSNAELDEINPRHAEHYYFAHQQLMARYLLEKEHLKNVKNDIADKLCENMYNPYLMYDNGLQFPTRSASKFEWSDKRAYLTTIDIAMKECFSRGFIIMDNGTKINMTDENHTDLLAKIIRANLDGVKAAKIVRNLYGYGGQVISEDSHNPSPSALHHPQTSLRDPVYWNLIKKLLSYFLDFKSAMEPFDLLSYESDDIIITDAEIPNIETYFKNYEFSIDRALVEDSYNMKSPYELLFTVNQRRLSFKDFSFYFNVNSLREQAVVARLFLGPQCDEDCWDDFDKFYQLDAFNYTLKEGSNIISWSPDSSTRLSDDYSVNFENDIETDDKYSMFKFPKTLVIPRGLEQGLNLTLFIIVTPVTEYTDSEIGPEYKLYRSISYELDTKPLGFPFHREASGFNPEACNYKFYNVTIYHQNMNDGRSQYFSSNIQ
ncbi:unnamed protein product [Plutella xylostella]|uniref:(diamondback moth) hypothetical protein n=1 Tax=Plutella xylostella TaxID=51655 RepID=A0A8S4E770_PLUXY|nr:unnamed protein product [Plutella xylostella]